MTTMYQVRNHLDQVKAEHHAADLAGDKGRISRVCVVCCTAWPCDELRSALRATATTIDVPETPHQQMVRKLKTAVDDEYRAKIELVAGDWLHGDRDMTLFVAALMGSRRGPEDLISQNDVRTKLLEPTVKGLRCSIEHHRFSGMYSRARKEGLIARHKDDAGRVATDICTTSPTGNNGRLQVIYRWTGRTP